MCDNHDVTTSPNTHDITVAEHGARKGVLFVTCSCGWSHGSRGVQKPVNWDKAQRVAAAHKASAS